MGYCRIRRTAESADLRYPVTSKARLSYKPAMGDDSSRLALGRTNSDYSGRSYAQPSARSGASLRDDHPNAPGIGPSLDRSATPMIVAQPERTVPRPTAQKRSASDIQGGVAGGRRARPPTTQVPPPGEGVVGDIRFVGEPPRVYLKLDRLGGDLWGLKRAVDQ